MSAKLLRRASPRGGRAAPRLAPAEGYRRWASDYGRVPNALQRLEDPALERLLPAEFEGRRVLDLGCGKGRGARLARSRGAAEVVAADFSLAMLNDREGFAGVRRTACGVTALPFRETSFDVVICALVLGHVAELEPALDAVGSVLRPGGCAVVSDFHPFATLRGWERTFVDDRDGRTFAIEQHLHLFSEYVTGLGRAGLVLEALEEPAWEGTPVVFVLRARKT